ncbi:Endonuclease, Uma2 family (restriction endonuclease fold) [Methylomagnum ishizawai]|uniref:Endonuclease, Uma2 family (Restriction endonuclease fold) n=1 Tax=Methylomagnum ishizawai TaxID=1760988 RepID=A0A1Y6D0B0_9GAMM|nr:Uma2 family endonuclease [Methylomagnum ishizawai]SMF93435.1 Endonuclease, Uma2 family (restriction endonuclease fold) [Methylomagnum ishizawai]
MGAVRQVLLSEAEYLALEAQSRVRHEYVDGQVYAMAGGSQRHNRIALNVASSLLSALRGKPYRVFMSDVKLKIARDNAYYYPDVMVACGAAERIAGDENSLDDPVLVVEVLSPSTETTDRREKLAAYRRLPTVQEYVLVNQDSQQVEIYRREGDIGWVYLSYEAGETVELKSVGLDMPIAAWYEGTDIVTGQPPVSGDNPGESPWQ